MARSGETCALIGISCALFVVIGVLSIGHSERAVSELLDESLRVDSEHESLHDSPALDGSEAWDERANRACMSAADVGRAAGSWSWGAEDAAVWTPSHTSCATRATPYHTSAELRRGAADLLRGRRLYFLGDSVARDLLSHASLLAGGDASASERLFEVAKRRCEKPNPFDREIGANCSSELWWGDTTAHFSWLQWMRVPHRVPAGNGRGAPYRRFQEVDSCCALAHGGGGSVAAQPTHLDGGGSLAAVDGGMMTCLSALLGAARSSDVLILRLGLNYALYSQRVNYEAGGWEENMDAVRSASVTLPDWRRAFANDTASFLRLLPAAFPGTIIWWHLTPLVPRVGLVERCDELAFPFAAGDDLPEMRRVLDPLLAAAAARNGALSGRLIEVGPPDFVRAPPTPLPSPTAALGVAAGPPPLDMRSFYRDCMHHRPALDLATLSLMLSAAKEALLARPVPEGQPPSPA